MSNRGLRDKAGEVMRVGFYGCGKTSTLVRCSWAGESHSQQPRTAIVECPACETRHRVLLMWRNPSSREEWNTAMVKL